MDFKDSIKKFSERIIAYKDLLHNEEQTKDTLIKPFVGLMGFDCSNPLEVKSEVHCDVGIKKGEKVDYCILNDGEPIILIECKRCGENLSTHYNQLFRYFSVSEAKFAILTNGITYQFFTDLVKPNIMDKEPFIEVDFTNIEDWQIDEIHKFHKSVFDAEPLWNSARKRKDMEELTTKLKSTIKSELDAPSDDLTSFFIEKVCGKELSQELFVHFSEVAKRYIVDLTVSKPAVITTRSNNIVNHRKNSSTYSDKDYSQYAINGKGCYGKCPLPKEVVKEYLKHHNILSIKQLQDIFLDDLQGSRLGVIRAKIEDKNVKRYYKIEDHKLGIIYVCKDWYPWTITNFISHVNTHIEGITITKIE